jgi:hypothetical protein
VTEDAKWICLTHSKTAGPLVLRYDKIETVLPNPDDEKESIVTTAGGVPRIVTESVKDIFLVSLCDSPLLAIQHWEEK